MKPLPCCRQSAFLRLPPPRPADPGHDPRQRSSSHPASLPKTKPSVFDIHIALLLTSFDPLHLYKQVIQIEAVVDCPVGRCLETPVLKTPLSAHSSTGSSSLNGAVEGGGGSILPYRLAMEQDAAGVPPTLHPSPALFSVNFWLSWVVIAAWHISPMSHNCFSFPSS